jgi:3-hydroxybutyryl-CoA dehydrogenase
LDTLPAGAGWLHLHRSPSGAPFAEVVNDEAAAIGVPDAVTVVLDVIGAPSVEVLALPGLVIDRLAHCMVNEAATLVEEGTAGRDDIDTALRLGMNHPRGPFDQLRLDGAVAVLSSLRSMATASGDPRYRPTQLLCREAAGVRR